MRSRYENVKARAVFVHGAGGGAWEWAVWRRVFAAHGWRVVANDLQPAQGGLARTHLHDYARQVEHWARADASDAADEALSRTVLVGASLGGLLVSIAAARIAPAALVLVNPLPPADIEPQPAFENYPDIVPWGSARSFASTCRAMPDADDAARWFAYRHWRDESGNVLREARSAHVAAPTCPTLVIAGEADTDVPAQASRALARAYAAEFVGLPGASHLGPLLGRDTARVAQCCLEWIERAAPTMPRAR